MGSCIPTSEPSFSAGDPLTEGSGFAQGQFLLGAHGMEAVPTPWDRPDHTAAPTGILVSPQQVFGLLFLNQSSYCQRNLQERSQHFCPDTAPALRVGERPGSGVRNTHMSRDAPERPRAFHLPLSVLPCFQAGALDWLLCFKCCCLIGSWLKSPLFLLHFLQALLLTPPSLAAADLSSSPPSLPPRFQRILTAWVSAAPEPLPALENGNGSTARRWAPAGRWCGAGRNLFFGWLTLEQGLRHREAAWGLARLRPLFPRPSECCLSRCRAEDGGEQSWSVPVPAQTQFQHAGRAG